MITHYPLTEMELPELDIVEGCGNISLLYGVFEISARGKNGWHCLSVEAAAPANRRDRRAKLPDAISAFVLDQVNRVQRDLVDDYVQEHIEADGITSRDNEDVAPNTMYHARQSMLAAKAGLVDGASIGG